MHWPRLDRTHRLNGGAIVGEKTPCPATTATTTEASIPHCWRPRKRSWRKRASNTSRCAAWRAGPGVSHAAPAHHFGDADGLLTALAARAFERLVDAMETAAAAAAPAPLSRLVAIGIGYIDYAESQPHLFSLLFASDRPDWADPGLRRHADAAFATLRSGVETFARPLGRDADAIADLIPAVWAMAHGLATLFATRRSRNVTTFDCDDRRARFESILRAVARAF